MVKPKKHLGQHFLRDGNIARKIVEQLPLSAVNILEIGPGTGVLTRHLLNREKTNLKVIEIDREAVCHLQETFPGLSNHIIHDDFLSSDLSGIFNGNFSVIGNFPYNISSQILFRILQMQSRIDDVVGMFQKEVADRIVSPPGSRVYGILSVLVRVHYKPEKLFEVAPDVFYPVPKVKSAVIRLTKNQTKYNVRDEKLLHTLVKTAFNQRRKTLKNALKKLPFPDDITNSELFSRRAEELSIDDYITLAAALENTSGKK
ncbi:MAG: ribosomal RNA small subunit methyltransferase A [Bacteroidales bacterium]|nr:ribosomal RNA small subunit methyltransferase A [Bacteroidales bacterium]